MTIASMLPELLAELGIHDESPDLSSDDFTMMQVRALINAAGRDIHKRVQWSTAVKSSSTVSEGLGSLVLPDDFQEMLAGGAVRLINDTTRRVRRITDVDTWQFLDKYEGEITYYNLNNGHIHFTPRLSDKAQFFYITKNWLKKANNDQIDEVVDGTETPIFPEELIKRGVVWRWRRQKGLQYDDQLAEFEADLEEAIKADRGA